ncbi:MAG: hypothetical protein DWQ01_13430 [Planctomycetota bacterium]|nr:MAG: hypothetical protein DWQ01_13430 [Planctomycetota bacterium]
MADLVLVGGGHAHLFVLEALSQRPLGAGRVLLVSDRRHSIYSGMVPGVLEGRYRLQEAELDLAPLAQRAGVEVLWQSVRGLDPLGKTVLLSSGERLAYQVLSLDIGSSVLGLDRPGVLQHAIPSRPIRAFVETVESQVQSWRDSESKAVRIAVVGAGAAGLEVSTCLQWRLRSEGIAAEIHLFHSQERLLPERGPFLNPILRRFLNRRGVVLHDKTPIQALRPGFLLSETGKSFAADWTLWLTGAAPQPGFQSTSLVTDSQGFLQIRNTLQLRGHEDLFAAGDCASLGNPPPAKAGVYAVRQGPILAHNLLAKLQGKTLKKYRPQSDFLVLLNLGGGQAVGCKWGFPLLGGWVMPWKDRIDRRFMQRFRYMDSAPTQNENSLGPAKN